MHKFIPFRKMIVLEDEQLIIINKPSGISSLDERKNEQPSVLSLARKYCETAQLCHRIDKETSGILLIAKNPEAYREMAIAFEKRKVEKTYHAVIGGQLAVEHKSILLPIGQTKNGLAKIDTKEGRPAETIVHTLKQFRHFTLLECRPVTGRLHQIRIHLASQHFPLVCDASYGGKIPFLSDLKKDFKTSKWENEQGMMQRVALHARSLKFELLGKTYEVDAPYPKDFEVFVKLLEKFDA